MPRRERWSIIGAILEAIDEGSQGPKAEARVTTVALRSNVPYDRLVAYLDDLVAAGLITLDRTPKLTDRGRDFLRAYRQWRDALGRFGLD